MKHAGISHCAASLQTWVIKAPRLERRPARLSAVRCSRKTWRTPAVPCWKNSLVLSACKGNSQGSSQDGCKNGCSLLWAAGRGGSHTSLHPTPGHFSDKKLQEGNLGRKLWVQLQRAPLLGWHSSTSVSWLPSNMCLKHQEIHVLEGGWAVVIKLYNGNHIIETDPRPEYAWKWVYINDL